MKELKMKIKDFLKNHGDKIKEFLKIFTIIFVFLFLNSNLTVITSSTQDKNNSQNKLLTANSSGNS